MKSAIKQMVEQMKAELDGDLPRENRKAITPFYQVACRLLAEEQAQKPTAPAGLVEELRKVSPLLERDFVIALAIPYMKQAQHGYTAEGAAIAFVDALSRYRPAPSDEGLRAYEQLRAAISTLYSMCNCYDWGEMTRAIGHLLEVHPRHPSTAKSDRCGELLERLEAKSKEWYLAGDMRSDTCGELTEILSEFSKDADKEAK